MKRANNLFPKLVSEENLRLAIFAVNVTHRFHPHHRPNRTVARVEADIDRYVKELREIITGGYEANEPRLARRWEATAPESGGTYRSRDCGLTSMCITRSFRCWSRS